MPMGYEERTYRRSLSTPGLVAFTVVIKETDLHISASRNLARQAKHAAAQARLSVERYIRQHPAFRDSLSPLMPDPLAPPIIQKMLAAACAATVGPMAAVAGAIAEHTGRSLLALADEVIVENGGDLFIKTDRNIVVSIFAGNSPLSQRVGLRLPPCREGLSVCTSSGTVGHSLSFGRADAVTVRSACASHADAAATALGNVVKSSEDIQPAIRLAQHMAMVQGVLIILGESMGVWGDLELVRL